MGKHVNNRSNSGYTILTISFILIIFFWRLNFLGNFFNLFLLILIVLGITKKDALKAVTTFSGAKIFWLIVSGITVSIIISSIEIGSFFTLIEKNNQHTSLTFLRVLNGLVVFIIIIINLRDEISFNKVMLYLLYASVFFIFLLLAGFSELFIELIGIENYKEIGFFEDNSHIQARVTFPTMDANTFGSICSFLFILSVYFYLSENNRIKFLLFAFVFLTATFITLSRSSSIKLIVELILFIAIYFKMNVKNVVLLSIAGLTFFISLANIQSGSILLIRWQEFYFGISDVLTGNASIYSPTDSFQYRLMRASLGIPSTFSGWVFGTGGIQRALIGESADHIEYTNWLFQFGLVTFIPMVYFQLYLVKQFIKRNHTSITKMKDKQIRAMKAFGISAMIGLMMEMLNSPIFILLWIYFALLIVFYSFYRTKIESQRSYVS